MLKHYKVYQTIFSDVEKATGEWSLVQVQQSIPIFNSIVNLSQRTATIIKAQKQTDGFGVLEQFADFKDLLLQAHMEKLEYTMKLLRKALNLMEIIKDKIVKAAQNGIQYYETNLKNKLTVEQLAYRSVNEPSISEIVETLQLIERMYEREYWAKRDLVESIRYDDPNVDGIYTQFITEPNIDAAKVQSMFVMLNPAKDPTVL